MKQKFRSLFPVFLGALILYACSSPAPTESPSSEKEVSNVDPLPSWNEGANKEAVLNFVAQSTDVSHPGFIEPALRIATFDNDGTLWSEQPVYFQLFFVLDRIKDMAPAHPEWETTPPYSYALSGDMEGLAQSGMKGLMTLLMTTHAGMDQAQFEAQVIEWAASARHRELNRPYTELVYQPMLELLTYLQANDFKTYIVSGGGVDFMRPLVSEVYNIPPEQIIGSTIKTAYDYNNGQPVIKRLPEMNFVDDKEGKPENIQRIIGRVPVLVGGNSDGDLAMMQWASTSRSFLNIYVHHTDSVREWAYDRDSHIGKLDQGLDQAQNEGWTVVDMEKDWKVIYPFELN